MSEIQQQVGEVQETPQEVQGEAQSQPEVNWTELTGGQYETFDQLWDDHQQYREAVAKAEQPEYDDYLKGIIDRYQKSGDLKPYFEAMSTNYDEMSPEGVLRARFKRDNPNLSDRALDFKFRKEVMSKFNLDAESATEEEIEVAKELLEAEAASVRDQLKADQQKYLSEDKTSKQQEEINKQLEEFYQLVDSSDSVKAVLEQKQIPVKYGDGEVGYGVKEPEKLVEMIKDNGKFFELFKTESGVDLNKAMRVFSYAMDEEGYLKSVAGTAKAEGAEQILDEIKNPSDKEGRTPSFAGDDFFAALGQKFIAAKKN